MSRRQREGQIALPKIQAALFIGPKNPSPRSEAPTNHFPGRELGRKPQVESGLWGLQIAYLRATAKSPGPGLILTIRRAGVGRAGGGGGGGGAESPGRLAARGRGHRTGGRMKRAGLCGKSGAAGELARGRVAAWVGLCRPLASCCSAGSWRVAGLLRKAGGTTQCVVIPPAASAAGLGGG